MNAADIACALGDARRQARAWRCICPLHGGHSLVLRDGDGGRVLVMCWGGCDRFDVLAELRRRGLLGGRAEYAPRIMSPPGRHDDASRTARALNIWRGATDGAHTIVRRYLGSRGIVLDHWPRPLRFHPRCPRPKDDAGNLVPPMPAMLALVEHAERGPVAVHCNYLRPNGTGKADIEIEKAIFGSARGGAVCLGAPRMGEWLAVAEGIETTLAVTTSCAMPGWAALSAGGIRSLVLPPEATHVLIAADNDASGTGECAARDAAQRWLAEGRRVRIAMPPEPGTDMADVLLGRSYAEMITEVRHVA